MMIKAGTKLRIIHSRKGTFECVATKDFNPSVDEFFPLKLITKEVSGMRITWQEGEEIPCRNMFVTKIEKI